MRRLILFLIQILIFGCENRIDQKKLNNYIKEKFQNYKLLEDVSILEKHENFILVSFAKAGTEGIYSVVLSYKGNKFDVMKIKKGDELKEAIFVIGEGDKGKYKFDVKIGKKLKVYEYSIYGKRDDYCNVSIYELDKENNIFVFNESESLKEKESYCYEICQKIEVDSDICSPKVDNKKLTEFIKNNFKNYKLLKEPVILDRYKNLILVRFSTDYKGVILLYKGNDFKILKIRKGNEEENAIFKTSTGKQVGSGVRFMKNNKIVAYDYSINNKNNDYCDAKVYDFDSQNEIFMRNRESKDIENSTCMAICAAIYTESPACSNLFLSLEDAKFEDEEKVNEFIREFELSAFGSVVVVKKFKDLFIGEREFLAFVEEKEGEMGRAPIGKTYYLLKYKNYNLQFLKIKESNSYKDTYWSFSFPKASWDELNNYILKIGIDEKLRIYTFNKSDKSCEVKVYNISDNELLLDEDKTNFEKGVYCRIKKIIASL